MIPSPLYVEIIDSRKNRWPEFIKDLADAISDLINDPDVHGSADHITLTNCEIITSEGCTHNLKGHVVDTMWIGNIESIGSEDLQMRVVQRLRAISWVKQVNRR